MYIVKKYKYFYESGDVGIARFYWTSKRGRNMIAHIVKSPENFELTIIYNTHIVKHSDKIQTLNGI